uniref:Secreted protein n=1 Tax=Panagrellus redivivus TaxID=6233 RepID=A0A7E4VRC6_PANRE
MRVLNLLFIALLIAAAVTEVSTHSNKKCTQRNYRKVCGGGAKCVDGYCCYKGDDCLRLIATMQFFDVEYSFYDYSGLGGLNGPQWLPQLF